MRQITKFLMALLIITGLGLATMPMAQAQPGPHMMGGPGWGGGPRGGPGGPGWGGPRGGYYHHRGPGGGAIAGALIGGLAVGALAGATMAVVHLWLTHPLRHPLHRLMLCLQCPLCPDRVMDITHRADITRPGKPWDGIG